MVTPISLVLVGRTQSLKSNASLSCQICLNYLLEVKSSLSTKTMNNYDGDIVNKDSNTSILPPDNKVISDPHEEVKKLQNLVRQLELQNIELRRNQSPSQNVNDFQSVQVEGQECSHEDADAKDDSFSFDDVDIIDVEELDMSDEESWLYSPAKELTPEQKNISPYKWMRQELDDPNNIELQSVKNALVNKLDDINKFRPQLMSPNKTMVQQFHRKQTDGSNHNKDSNFVNYYNHSENSSAVPDRTHHHSNIDTSTITRHQNVNKKFLGGNECNYNNENFSSCPAIKTPLSASGRIDTRTFTRPKKKISRELFASESKSIPEHQDVHNVREDGQDSPIERLQDECPPSVMDEIYSCESSMTASGLYKFHDVEEVQEVARLQEESLRRSSSPSSSPKHISSSNSHEQLSYHVTEDGMYVNHVVVGEYAQSCKNMCIEENYSFENSANSSPTDSSSFRINHSEDKHKASLGRSMPNLSRGSQMQRMKNIRQSAGSSRVDCVTDEQHSVSPSHLTGSKRIPAQVRRDSHPLPYPSAVSKLRDSSASRRSSSPGARGSSNKEPYNVVANSADSSPVGVFNGKSGLARPGSRLPAPKARSGLPLPSSYSRLPQRSSH